MKSGRLLGASVRFCEPGLYLMIKLYNAKYYTHLACLVFRVLALKKYYKLL
jgi:hypothetical protein